VEAAMSTASEKSTVNALAGTVRLSVAEGFGGTVLAPALPAFLDRHPGLQIEMDASPGYLSPTTRKVDIAITSSAPESSRLVVERLTDYQLGLYASRKYLQKQGMPRTREDLRRHEFVGCVDDLIYSEQLNFLEAFAPNLQRHLKCSAIRVQIALAAAGGGIGAFPHFLVEDYDELVPVLPEIMVTRTYWMATHSELYEIGRVRAVHDWICALAAEHRAHLTPRQPQPAALSIVRG
jgi:DNA-binding transcriptional LysR family regulator